MHAVWNFLLKFKFDYRNIFCPLNKMWCDRSKLYGLFFHLFCSEFMGIYPVYGSVRRICPTSFLKQIMYMMCGEAILCWIQWPKRGWADTPSSHIHTEHTYVSYRLLEQSWEELRQSVPSSESLCSHMPWGSLLLWGCGDRLLVSWWILDSPRRTQNRILFGFSSMYLYFSVFLCIQKSFCDITYRCWCSHKLILCLVFNQLQEVPHWGCVER